MDKTKWKHTKRIEEKYTTLLNKLLLPVRKEINKANGDMKEIEKILKNTSKSPTFKRKGKEIAKSIATMVWQDNARNWREAAIKGSRGKEINNLLQKELKDNVFMRQVFEELLKYNATLIETLPLNISEKIISHIVSKNLIGERAEDIAKEIKSFIPDTSKASAKLIARTETSKFSSALTQARSIDLDINCYVWKTSEDSRVRSSHNHMDGVIIFYKHPPIPEKLDSAFKGKKLPKPYHAGNIYNCRCYQEPLIDFNDVKWPHKVYNWKTNKIEMMTLNKFKEFGGFEYAQGEREDLREGKELKPSKRDKLDSMKEDFLEGLRNVI